MTEAAPPVPIEADSTSKKQDQTFQAVGQQVQHLAREEASAHGDFDGQLEPTEVIDSLCMNCEKDVRLKPSATTDRTLY
jgi:hypothetical protein